MTQRIRRWLLFLFPAFISFTCGPSEPIVLTVKGPVATPELGRVLHHEHVMVDFIGARQTGPHRWVREEVITIVLPYLEELRTCGVNTLIECTPVYLGRDATLLLELSEVTGMNLLTNTGYYGALNDKYIPADAFRMTADEMAALWTEEFETGIDGTGIRPGFLKIAVDTDSQLSTIDETIVRAACRTHLKTGLPIASHTGPDGPAFAQLSILNEEGVSLEAFIWVHAQAGSMEGRAQAARMGCWISLDDVSGGPGNIERYVDMISHLIDQNLLNRVLLSHDAGWYSVGEASGGDYRGYTELFTHLIPRLREEGLEERDFRQMLEINPQNAYRLRKRFK